MRPGGYQIMEWLRWFWANLEWWQALTAAGLASVPFLRKAYRRGLDVLGKLDTVHEQVLPNGGKTLIDKVNKLAKAHALDSRRLRYVVKNSDALLFEADADGSWTLATYKLAELCGLQPAEMHKRGWLSVVAEEDRDRVWLAWVRSIKEDIPYSVTFHIESRETGSKFRVHSRAETWRDDDGAVLRYHGEFELVT